MKNWIRHLLIIALVLVLAVSMVPMAVGAASYVAAMQPSIAVQAASAGPSMGAVAWFEIRPMVGWNT